jgi:hypothetical protein
MKTKPIEVSVTIGKPDGHIPGNNYHDVEATITRKSNGRWLAVILETWGRYKCDDDEPERNEVVGRGATLDAAVQQAEGLAAAANISRSYLAQALSQAAMEAEAEAESDAENQVTEDEEKTA